MIQLTEFGLEIEGLDEIRDGLSDDWRAAFGPSVDVSDESPDGVLLGIMAERFALLNEGIEQVHMASDPDAAGGASLEALCALTGTTRALATRSTVTLTLTGTPATVVAAASRVETATTQVEFETLVDATIVALSARASTTAYDVGDRVTSAGNAYVCVEAGTTGGSGAAPTTTGDDITDGAVHWRYMGEGTGAVDVAARATTAGPLLAGSGDLTVIVTPVGGWASATNLLDADPGSAEETDPDLRVRRVAELAAQGATTREAIRAELLRVPGVTAVTVFVNDTDTTDSDGVPPHSIEVLVQGGDDQAIWDQLLASVAAGIGTHGDEVGVAVDSQGTEHTMRFTRPEEIEVYVDVTVVVDPRVFPVDGEDQVKAAIVAKGDTRAAGHDVRAIATGAPALDVNGVLDVDEVLIGTAPSPGTSTTIPVSLRQIAVYDTSRVDVTVVEETP